MSKATAQKLTQEKLGDFGLSKDLPATIESALPVFTSLIPFI
jgi:hypothetical protein